MEVTPTRDVKIGTIVEEMLDVFERNAVMIVVFIVAVSLVSGAIAYFGLNYSSFAQELGKQFITAIVAFVATFLLLVSMLRKGGFLKRDADDSFLPFVGASFLIGIGTMVGLFLLVLPGLYLAARWSVAQQVLLARGAGVIEAMKESWERTAGSEFSIIVILFVLFLVQIGAGFLIPRSLGADNLVGIGVAQVVQGLLSVIGPVLGVALYKLVVVDRDRAAGTFA